MEIHKNRWRNGWLAVAVCASCLVVWLMPADVVAQSIAADKLRMSDAELAKALVRSEMRRSPQAWALEGARQPKWTYTIGLELEAMLGAVDCVTDDDGKGADVVNGDRVEAYAMTFVDALIDGDGLIRGYRRDDYKLDDINSGKLVLKLMQRMKDRGVTDAEVGRLKHVVDTLYAQFATQPRTAEGGFWHKRIYPDQMWLDGLYMSAPFRARYVMEYGTDDEQKVVWDDIVKQFLLAYGHTRCLDCGLPHHAWDAVCRQSWADSVTGRSSHAWGRAVGWMMMALVDVLEVRHDPRLESVFDEVSHRLLALQNRDNGCWQQVLDCTGREGNYFEMSASAMVAYSWLKGVRLGLLPKRYRKAACRTLDGIRRNFLSFDELTGLFTLTNICAVAGLSADRDGSYTYYINEPRRDNDPKGMGPLIMALTEAARR